MQVKPVRLMNGDETYVNVKEAPITPTYFDRHHVPHSRPLHLFSWTTCSIFLTTLSDGTMCQPVFFFHGERQRPRKPLRHPPHPVSNDCFPVSVAFTSTAFNRAMMTYCTNLSLSTLNTPSRTKFYTSTIHPAFTHTPILNIF